LGPAVNALNPFTLGAAFSHGNPLTMIASGLSSAWAGAGTMGQIGITIGTATALAGSLAIGAKVGKAAGRLCGLPKEQETAKPINWKNWGTVGLGTTLMTTGVAGGIVGGIALAGGAAAAGSVLSGLLHSGFHAAALSGMGESALVAGAIGGVVSGVVGATGGAALTKMAARHVIDPLSTALNRGVDSIKDGVDSIKEGQQDSSKKGKTHSHMVKGAVHGALALGGSALLGAMYPGGPGAGAAAGLLALGSGSYAVASDACGEAVLGSGALGAVVGAGSAAAGSLGPVFVLAATAVGAGVGAAFSAKVDDKRPLEALPVISKNTLKGVAKGMALMGGSAILGNLYGGAGAGAAAGLSAIGVGALSIANDLPGEGVLGLGAFGAVVGAATAAGGQLGAGFIAASLVLGASAGAILANIE
jgi:hypothetical protein